MDFWRYRTPSSQFVNALMLSMRNCGALEKPLREAVSSDRMVDWKAFVEE